MCLNVCVQVFTFYLCLFICALLLMYVCVCVQLNKTSYMPLHVCCTDINVLVGDRLKVLLVR